MSERELGRAEDVHGAVFKGFMKATYHMPPNGTINNGARFERVIVYVAQGAPIGDSEEKEIDSPCKDELRIYKAIVECKSNSNCKDRDRYWYFLL
jgi:hypothetical protein